MKEPSKTKSKTPLDDTLANQLESFKPEAAVTLTRKKRKATSVDEVKEIDFTRQFTTKTKPMPDLKKLKKTTTSSLSATKPLKGGCKSSSKTNTADSSFDEASPMENCGFCSDDTPCVCREAAKEAARLNASLNGQDMNVIVEEVEEEQEEEEVRGEKQRSNVGAGIDMGDVTGRGEDYIDFSESRTLPPIQFNPEINNNNNSNNNHLLRKSSLPVMHPGPSVEIREITNLTPGAVPVMTRRNEEQNQLGQTVTTPTPITTQFTESSKDNNYKDDNDGGCTGNPGTCKQCQMDPMSTLFCTTVASKSNDSSVRPNLSRSGSSTMLLLNFGNKFDPINNNHNNGSSNSNNSNNAPSPIPPPLLATASYGNNNNNNNNNNNINSITGTSAPSPGTNGFLGSGGSSASSTAVRLNNGGMFIPCADAYKTLSRHKKFNSVDFSTLVGKLTTRGMQVEVQSVANVLRELDRRLYN